MAAALYPRVIGALERIFGAGNAVRIAYKGSAPTWCRVSGDASPADSADNRRTATRYSLQVSVFSREDGNPERFAPAIREALAPLGLRPSLERLTDDPDPDTLHYLIQFNHIEEEA